MTEQNVSTNSGRSNRSFQYVVDKCKEDPNLAEAVVILLDVCNELDQEEPGTGVEVVKSLKELADKSRQSKGVHHA